MSDISVLGLGLMGSALARALQQAGHKITVWNRSPEKMKPFSAKGATGASSVVSAVTASPVLLVCVDNYAVTEEILGSDEVSPHLSGRILIQLSTGTPQESQDAATCFNDYGVAYIDGAILVLPSGVGTEDAQILFAGSEAAFKQVEPMLLCLGGDLRYLGENVRAAATMNLAWLCQRLGLILGAVHGALLCRSEDVGTDIYATMFPEGDRVQMLTQVIHADDYGKPDVTVRAWHAVVQRLQIQARDSEINGEFPEFAAGILKRAISGGYGEEDVAALIKVFRAT